MFLHLVPVSRCKHSTYKVFFFTRKSRRIKHLRGQPTPLRFDIRCRDRLYFTHDYWSCCSACCSPCALWPHLCRVLHRCAWGDPRAPVAAWDASCGARACSSDARRAFARL